MITYATPFAARLLGCEEPLGAQLGELVAAQHEEAVVRYLARLAAADPTRSISMTADAAGSPRRTLEVLGVNRLAHPLRSLVLANTIGGVQDESYLALGRRIRPPEFNALPADVRELGPSYRAANLDGTRRWIELERSNRAPGTPPAAQTMRHTLTFALVSTIKPPTLVLTGGADLYAPPPVMQMFADRIKGAEFVVVPEAGHSTYWEQPEAFNSAVLAFMRKH